jgi:hypothetical protein
MGARPRRGGRRLTVNEQAVIDATQRWIADVVIGLTLCPFARRPFTAGLIRYVVTPAATEADLLEALAQELTALAGTPRSSVETTVLIHPNALADFLDYNDFLATADTLISDLGFRGTIQIASFHPHYQFAGTKPDAVENYTNRSPFPMLHLLREESISEVNRDPESMADIPARNVEMLKTLGRARILAMLDAVQKGEPPSPP